MRGRKMKIIGLMAVTVVAAMTTVSASVSTGYRRDKPQDTVNVDLPDWRPGKHRAVGPVFIVDEVSVFARR